VPRPVPLYPRNNRAHGGVRLVLHLVSSIEDAIPRSKDALRDGFFVSSEAARAIGPTAATTGNR
jgi:hypothetical protein